MTHGPQVENHQVQLHAVLSGLFFQRLPVGGASPNCFPPACRGCCRLWENCWGVCWGLRLLWGWTEVPSLSVRRNSRYFSSSEKQMFVVVIVAYLVQLHLGLLKWVFANKQVVDIIYICLNTIGPSRKKDTALCLAKIPFIFILQEW